MKMYVPPVALIAPSVVLSLKPLDKISTLVTSAPASVVFGYILSLVTLYGLLILSYKPHQSSPLSLIKIRNFG